MFDIIYCRDYIYTFAGQKHLHVHHGLVPILLLLKLGIGISL